jgi:multimeric flavodoxin WrbA
MKILVIYGQSHKGTTYTITQILLKKLKGEVSEVFLPRDFHEFCIGCAQCIHNSEKRCPHYDKLSPITRMIDEADLLIVASPVYVYHVTGATKSFLDHYGWRWMIHRPEPSMFRKQAVIITTAAGAGTKSAIKDIRDSLFYWGIARTYQFGIATYAVSYDKMSDQKKRLTDKKLDGIARRIQRTPEPKPSLKTRAFFRFYRHFLLPRMQENDQIYYQTHGLAEQLPWKNTNQSGT